MSVVVATVGPPTKKIGFPSNCLLSYTPNVLTMIDDTTKRTFEQKAQFDSIAPNFETFLARVPPQGKFRIVSFCSEFSILTTAAIKEYCLKLALIRFPPNAKESQFISIGFVYDSSVRDFLSLEDTDSEMLEMIETFDSSEVIDLLQCGLEKLRRIKDSVFVIRIGTEDSFLEWVIIPKADSYVPSPSMAGLPPNEKLFYILNLLNSTDEQSIDRFIRASSIFRLVADSFSDVPTFWVFHLAENSTLKSNATLCKIASMLLRIKKLQINYYPTNLFYVRNENADVASSAASEEYMNSLSKEELEELDYLRAKVGGEAFLSSRSKSSERRSYRLQGAESMGTESIDAAFVEEEEEYEYEYSESDVEEAEDGSILRKPRRKNKIRRKKKEKETESQHSKSVEQMRAEEEELRRKDQEKEEERRKAIELLRQSRPKKDDSPSALDKKKTKTKRKSLVESTQNLKMSRRDKVSERIARLKQLRALEEEEEEEEEESVTELREMKKDDNLTPEERYMREMKKRLKNRQNKFTKISILVNKAQRAAKDRNTPISTIEDLQRQVTEALEEAEQFRKDAKDEIAYLKDTLAYRRKKHEQNQQDIRDIRHDYLERHCDNVLEKDRRKRKEAKKNAELAKEQKENEELEEAYKKRKKGQKGNANESEEADEMNKDKDVIRKKKERKIAITNRTPEYDMAVKYLEEEIEQVRKDISVLKKTQPNPAEA